MHEVKDWIWPKYWIRYGPGNNEIKDEIKDWIWKKPLTRLFPAASKFGKSYGGECISLLIATRRSLVLKFRKKARAVSPEFLFMIIILKRFLKRPFGFSAAHQVLYGFPT